MEPSVYREKWLALKGASVSGDELSQLARRIAYSFIDRYYQNGLYRAEYIELLCEMATSFTDAELNNRASSALFGIVVEELCDDYEEMPVETYSRVIRVANERDREISNRARAGLTELMELLS